MILPLLLGSALLAAPPPADTLVLEGGVRSPHVAADGRVVLEMRGDLWLLPAGGGRAVRLTDGAAWDREPAWTSDGRAVVFASDRGGDPGVWRVPVGTGGAAGEAEVVVDGPEPEDDPAPLPDGSVVFVRGRGAEADLWLLSPDGEERRLTSALGAETSPAASPDGRRIAYVAERFGRLRLHVRRLADSTDRALAAEHAAERPAWSPDGGRIAFTTRDSPAGTWVAALDGSYVNLASHLRAAPTWTPDGDLLLAGLPRQGPGYNGDPHRHGDRGWGDVFPAAGRLWRIELSATPGAGRVEVPVRAVVDRTTYAAEIFDRVWERLEDGYELQRGGSPAGLGRLRDEYRRRALAAPGERELEAVIDQLAREKPPLLTEASGRAAVSSAHPLATAAGLEILEMGGNVVDAAVAVSFALGVVEPDASGIGGYGAMLIHLRGMEAPTAIEFLTRVPQAATLENGNLLEEDGEIPDDGPVVANVPGTVAGMRLAWERYGSGRVTWAALLAPAIRLAEEGFVLDEAFPTTLRVERERYAKYPSSRALFFRDGEPLRPGDTLRNPDLAWTLRQIAEGGADAFYRGEIARRMVADLHGKGNAMRLHDLARYFAVEREPVRGTYRGHTVWASPPATSGGATLVAKLNLLERHADPRPYAAHAPTLHAMVEAWKLAPSTSGRIADPGLWPVDLEPFTSKDTAAARWRCFDRARSSAPGTDGRPPCEDGRPTAAWGAEGLLDCPDGAAATGGQGCRMTGTTAFAVGDADGNLVAVTQTLGTWGGNFYVTPGLGFLYNDKLGSYADEPDDYNARVPFARNSTSISPTLIFEGTGEDARPLAALGAAGNAWIGAAVYQTLVGIVDQGLGPQRALELPRFLPATARRPDGEREVVVQLEDAFGPGVLHELEALGHEVQRISRKGELRMGYGAAVVVGEGEATAGADPRRSGAAGAVGAGS